MKIFSLETKKHLVGWSITFSLVLNFLMSKWAINSLKNSIIMGDYFGRSVCNPFVENWALVKITIRVPFKILTICASQLKNFWLDFSVNVFILIIVIFIILSLIRYFKKRN